MGLAEKLQNIEEEIKGLSKEEQEKKVSELMASLSEDELDELQKRQCIFCMVSEGKIESFEVYEDSIVKAVLDINPASKGHIILFPKDHHVISSMMSDELTSHIFRIANILSKAAYEAMNAQGTNIYVANGKAAGQTSQHVLVHIIPRYKDDGLTIPWQGKKFENEYLKKIAFEIKGKIVAGKKEEKKESKIEKVAGNIRRVP